MFQLPKVYPITDQKLSGLSHSEQVSALAEGGATLVQLRDKTATGREFFLAAERALVQARNQGVQIVINDRVDIALALSAEGVHLGQDDMPPGAARRLLGPEAIIGLSTHNLLQALAANSEPVSYIALGPIFPTSSKAESDRVVGLDGLAKVRSRTELPLVAIGGITQANAREVFAAGADSIALISALLGEKDRITSKLKLLLFHTSP